MINDHLSDTDIQQFVLDRPNCDSNIIDHIHVCDSCKAKAEEYQLLFSAIRQQPTPAFDFDLPGLVLSQIAQPQPKSEPVANRMLIFLLVLIGLCFVIIAGWLFSDYFLNMFTGITSMAIYLTLTVAVTFLFFQGIEMYKRYHKQMDALNFN
jgi:hypothetical protein